MRKLIAAALLLGLAGYAWQGNPGLAGGPRRVAEADGQPFDDNVLKSLMRKSAAQRPLFFSKVPPGLFEHLMMANMQKEEAIR